jgi:hypothetical protein
VYSTGLFAPQLDRTDTAATVLDAQRRYDARQKGKQKSNQKRATVDLTSDNGKRSGRVCV